MSQEQLTFIGYSIIFISIGGGILYFIAKVIYDYRSNHRKVKTQKSPNESKLKKVIEWLKK